MSEQQAAPQIETIPRRLFFSSGPHLHLHFMDGPDMLTAAALPIALQAEGSTFAPQAGQIIGP